MVLGERYPLYYQEMLLDWKATDSKSSKESPQSVRLSSKCNYNCTLKELSVIKVILANPSITQKQISAEIGMSECTVNSITAGLVEKQIIVRKNGKRNGFWELV